MPKVVVPTNDVHKTPKLSRTGIMIPSRPGVSSIVGMSVCGTHPTFGLDGLPHSTTPAGCLSRGILCRDYAG